MTLSLAHKLALGFALIIFMLLAFGWYQLGALQSMREFAIATIDQDFRALQLLRRASNSQRDMRVLQERAWVSYLLGKEGVASEDTSVAQQQWHLARERTLAGITALETLAAERAANSESLERQELWSKIENNARESKQVASEIATIVLKRFEKINQNDLSDVSAGKEVLDELREKFTRVSERAEDLATELAANARSDIEQLHRSVNTTSIAVLAGVFLIGVLIAVLIYRSTTRPLATFMTFVSAIGQGDLSQRTENTGKDEIGRLGSTLNEMVGNLAEVAGQTKAAAENLGGATAELQASAQQQAASTSEQSAAVQQITSTLEEILQSGSQITNRAKEVAQSAEAASSASKSGLQAVTETGHAIKAIREQAERVAGTVVALTEKTQSVGEIIASVNEIAERSNLLALNAAIEASSAGESGNSFTVVAEEIKNLADQAKDATGQVQGLLREIQQGINSAVMQTEEAVKRAETGATQSGETERVITELARSVQQSVDTFEQIIAATNQQQIGVEQVSGSVKNIREASEQLAAGVGDLEQSAGNLNAMSSQLRQSVERYRV